MKLRVNLTAALAVVALVLAAVQSRLSRGWLIFIALLLAARWASQRQARKRAEILKEVPRRPLGLSEDSPDEKEPAS
jgi:hypothetical protein